MKSLAVLALAVLAGCASATPGGGRDEGRAPEIRLRQVDGRPVKGADLWKERPVLLVFMTSW